MKKFSFSKIAPSIGIRLTIIICAIVLTVWIAFAVSILFFNEIKKEYKSLIDENIPRVELSNSLAQNSAKLTALSTSILGNQNGVDDDEEREIISLSNDIFATLNNPAFTDFIQKNDPSQKELADRLIGISKLIEKRKLLNAQITQSANQLRFLILDLQDEVDSISLDYGYNIELMTIHLINDSSFEIREALAKQIQSERAARDLVLKIGLDGSLAELYVLQITIVSGENQFKQIQNLIFDVISRSNENVQQLPDTAAYTTIKQSIDGLNQLAFGNSGILESRRQWIETDSTFVAELRLLQNQFSTLQSQLEAIGVGQQIAVTAAADKFTHISRLATQTLLALTIFTGLGAVLILFGYIYRKIIRPIDQLAAAMFAISQGEKPRMMPAVGTDEIGKMSASVRAFQKSIDEREAAFDLLKKTQADLVQAGKMAALGNLSAGVSHEINQPLAAIKQRLFLLDKATTQNNMPNIEKQSEKIHALVERMNSTIVSLKKFARRSDYLHENISMKSVLKDAMTILKSKIKSADIKLDIDHLSMATFVKGDQILAEQVLINIISNAIDAIVENGGSGTIKIYGEVKNDIFELSVQDDGIGLHDVTVEQAFDPFVSTKGTGIGLGLGLSISYNIARDFGGDLRLVPNEGDGMRAIFILPLGDIE